MRQAPKKPAKRSQPVAVPAPSAPPTPRRLALDVLGRIFGDGRTFDDAFSGHSKLDSMEPRDRGFARLLVTTVLRRRGQIDDALDRYLKKAPDPKVRNILRLGAAQLMFLKTPAHAAVGETVALAEGRASYAQGLVNAVLRRLGNELGGLEKRQDPVRLNLPDWLWESWCAAYGEATVRKIVEVQLQEPPLDFSVKSMPKTWAVRFKGEVLAGNSVRTTQASGPIEDLAGFKEGEWWIQDLAATLPVRLLGPLAGRHLVDLCAAPGGKAAQLATGGAKVTAVEISEKRAERLRENLARLQIEADIVVADVLSWRSSAPVVMALLDAPCTATGTIRRHPDIPWQKTLEDVDRMAQLQAKLIRATLDMLVPGGILVYAVCSLQPEEGPMLVERLIAEGLPVARVPVSAAELGGIPADITPDGDVRSLPCHLAEKGGMDGFYISRLQRIA